MAEKNRPPLDKVKKNLKNSNHSVGIKKDKKGQKGSGK